MKQPSSKTRGGDMKKLDGQTLPETVKQWLGNNDILA
jgi:hypothetical protein